MLESLVFSPHLETVLLVLFSCHVIALTETGCHLKLFKLDNIWKDLSAAKIAGVSYSLESLNQVKTVNVNMFTIIA